MKAKNQLVLLSGIVVLLATATIAATLNVLTANADKPANTPNAYGKDLIAPNAQTGTWGSQVSSAAHEEGGASTHNGIADYRANGDKIGPHNNGQGGPDFRP